ncbi:MAG: hypothetical protein ABSB42_20960 [Tepidisphaeraceae bacterium]|jgi:hypothetical protein
MQIPSVASQLQTKLIQSTAPQSPKPAPKPQVDADGDRDGDTAATDAAKSGKGHAIDTAA